MDLREASRMQLRTWAANRLRDDMICALMAYDGTSFVRGVSTAAAESARRTPLEAYAAYSEGVKDAYLAANTDRFLFGNAIGNHSANDHSAALLNVDTTNDRLTAGTLRLLRERAPGADPQIRPMKTNDGNGEEWFVFFVGSRGMRDLRADPTISAANREARPREERPAGGFAPRPPGAGFTPRPPGAGGGGFRPCGPPSPPGKNFGPPKKQGSSSEKRWETKERGPKGPIKERYTGRLGGLYDLPDDDAPLVSGDFDDPATTTPEDDE
jgi:hypothetical protein